MKRFIIICAVLLMSTILFAQEVKTTDDPAFLKQVQGTWIFDEPGTWWRKVVFNGENITLYNAEPKKGRWNDEREGNNEIIHLKITNCNKVTKTGRNNYDGKPYSVTYSIIGTSRIDRNNHVGPFFSMSNGKLEQYGNSSLSHNNGHPSEPTIIYRKVQSNYSPWD